MLNIRILVVDDHGTLRKRIADYLRAQEGVEEVASRLGWSVSKTKSSLFRTRNKLKAYLEKEGVGIE